MIFLARQHFCVGRLPEYFSICPSEGSVNIFEVRKLSGYRRTLVKQVFLFDKESFGIGCGIVHMCYNSHVVTPRGCDRPRAKCQQKPLGGLPTGFSCSGVLSYQPLKTLKCANP